MEMPTYFKFFGGGPRQVDYHTLSAYASQALYATPRIERFHLCTMVVVDIAISGLVVVGLVITLMVGVKLGIWIETARAKRESDDPVAVVPTAPVAVVPAAAPDADALHVWVYQSGKLVHAIEQCRGPGAHRVTLSRWCVRKKLVLVSWCDKCASAHVV